MKVLVIDASQEIVDMLSVTLRLPWPDAIIASTDKGTKGVEMAETGSPDIVILDLNLPDIDGFEVLKQIRLFSDVPIIVLTIRQAELDKVRGFEMGADDYITKPFSAVDLLSRVKAILRRAGMWPFEGEAIPTLVAGNLTINFATREVFFNDEHICFSPTEYSLLCLLVRNEGRTVMREALIRQVWGGTEYVDTSVIKKYIYQLRTKLGNSGELPQIIVCERGIGYRFVKPSVVHK